MASSYLGGQIGDKVAGKITSTINIKSSYLKYTLAPTIGGGSGGFLDGFFTEIMLGSGDVNNALKSGGKSAAFGAGSSFIFSSIDYGFNKSVIKQKMNASSSNGSTMTPYDNYYNPDVSTYNIVPKTGYNSISYQTSFNNWNTSINLTIMKGIYQNNYNHMK